MQIKDMFEDDIERKINGVIQVQQDEEKILLTEVKEYVVTKELRRHFIDFFDAYSESFESTNNDIGVWITGFFGSGKSHFLKMLSYLLENKELDGKKVVEYFRDKFDDPATFMKIEKATSVETETILFNIDVESSGDKDGSAVTRVFRKVFYNHLGFYGNDTKVAQLEKYLTKIGKYEEFCKVFEETTMFSWKESRDTFLFIQEEIVDVLSQVTDMSQNTALSWINDDNLIDDSVSSLVSEIKEYVDSKDDDFRLLFMIDEVGQYVGTNTNMLLNLQSIVEELGSRCRGKVWVVATGQEALDEIIKLRSNEFSRIQARFHKHLSLTSSSVDEVIEKRLLTKTDEANKILTNVYDNNANVIRNLYTFTNAKSDLKGYSSADEFCRIYPFVPYQFITIQTVYNEVRKSGQAGSHQSSGERSMLSGFQESAIKLEDKNELSIAPMYLFYDAIHGFLDRSIRGVVERAQRAADNHEGLEDYDINVLKLLYLTLHIDDIPSTIDNLTVLMADTINVDKIALKAKVRDSLERLLAQNYISYYSGVYKFLTDDEQQVAREIRNTDVNSSEVVNKIGSIIYDSIFEGKKFRYDNNDYEFNRFIDNQSYSVGSVPNGIRLTFITIAYNIDSSFDKTKIKSDSKSLKSATCILSDSNTNYYQDVEKALKISKYINKKNVNSLSDQIQDIIKRQNIDATNLLNKAKEEIADAIVDGEWLIYGENETVNGGTASSKINNALNKLAEEVYDNHYMINKHYASEEEIVSILKSENPISEDINQEALNSIYRYIDMQFRKNIPLTIKDIVDRYTSIPYGWKEIDIVGLMTVLIKNQKINIERNGSKVDTNNPNMITYLRKRTEVVSTKVIFRESLDEKLLRYSRNFIRKYFDIMSVPEDEDSIVKYINDNFTAKRDELYNLRKIYYNNYVYPGQNVVDDGIELIGSILKKVGDHKSFLEYIKSLEEDLYDFKEDIEEVDEFFDNQVKLFDNARKLYNSLQDEQMYFISNVKLTTALSDINDVITIKDPYNYSKISRLNNYIATINEEYGILLKVKRKELSELIDQCNEIIETYKNDKSGCDTIIYNTQTKYDCINKSLTNYKKVLRIEQEKDNVLNLKDETIKEINKLKSSVIKDKSVPYNAVEPEIVNDTANKQKIVEYQRNVIFRNGVTLTSEQQVDNYLKEAKDYLMKIIDKNGGVKIE